MDALEAAWDAVHEGPPSGRTQDRGKAPQTVTGAGPDEAAALRDLDDQLRGVDRSKSARLEELRHRLRPACVEGAEGWARENLRRGRTADELQTVVKRLPGRWLRPS